MSIYADQVAVDLAVIQPDGTTAHIGPTPLEQLTTTEQPGELSMRLEAVVPNVDTDIGPLQQLMPLNATLLLSADYGDGMRPVQSFLVRRRRFIDDGHQYLMITAYDGLWELNKDEFVMVLQKPLNSAVSIIGAIAGLRKTPYDGGGPGTPILQQRFMGMTRLAAINQLLQWGWQYADPNGPDKDPYYVQWRDGMMRCIQPGRNVPVYWVRDTESVARFEQDTSIENLVTEVYIYSAGLEFVDPNDTELSLPLGALVPDPRGYADKIGGAPTAATYGMGALPTNPLPIIAQEADALAQMQQFKDAQSYAKIRKIQNFDIGQTQGTGLSALYEQALDTLYLNGIPWDVRNVDIPLLPRLRRGDALKVTSGTMDGIGIVTGVEHDFTAWISHVTIDSSGIFGMRLRRQRFVGQLPGDDGILTEADLGGLSPGELKPAPNDLLGRTGGWAQVGTGPAPMLVPGNLAESAIQYGMSVLGNKPYSLGAACGRSTFNCNGPFDCSGFVNWCFHKAGATWNLPQTGMLANQLPRIPDNQVQRGDIMVMAAVNGDWSSTEGAHTGIWMGDGNLLQCGSKENGVGIWGPVPGWPHVFVRPVPSI